MEVRQQGESAKLNVSSETLRHLTANPCRLARRRGSPAMPPRGPRACARAGRLPHVGARARVGWRLRMTGRKILQKRSRLMCFRTKRITNLQKAIHHERRRLPAESLRLDLRRSLADGRSECARNYLHEPCSHDPNPEMGLQILFFSIVGSAWPLKPARVYSITLTGSTDAIIVWPPIGGMDRPIRSRRAIQPSMTEMSSLRASSTVLPVAQAPGSSGTETKIGSSLSMVL